MPFALGAGMQSTQVEKQQRHRASRGFGLIEIVVSVAIIAMISGAITVAVIKIALDQKIELTKTNGETLRSAVALWRASGNDTGECPTVKELLADGALARSKSTKADAWGQPWRIECDASDATVVSLGPDKLPDTEDDIRVPPS